MNTLLDLGPGQTLPQSRRDIVKIDMLVAPSFDELQPIVDVLQPKLARIDGFVDVALGIILC